MNRLLCICVMLISQLVLYAQNSYKLTLQASPQNSAYFDYKSTEVQESSMLYIYAYPRSGYVFDRWEENGTPISTDRYFYYTMPNHNVTLTAVSHFDPSVPDNPISPAVKHWMTLESNPKQAGWFNWSNRTQVVEGSEMDVYAYNYRGYRFVEWQMDGETVSKQPSYYFMVPSTDFSLVAVYEFAPVTPPNPGRNYFANGEVIIDDFSDGLYDAIWQVSNGEMQSITSLTVIGKLNDNDWYATRELPNCSIVDLSRTTGLTYVPSWSFEYVQSLNSIILPASIRHIGYGAFYECSSLTTLTVLSTTPPQMEGNVFYGCDTENLTVFVPAASVPLYRDANVWKDLNIQPLKSDVKSLQVNMPDEIDINVYKGMYLELFNVQSGQRQRYVITDRTSYTFANLMHNTEYNVYLKDSKDMVLGSIMGVKIENEDKDVTFFSLLMPRTVTMQVTNLVGEDLTSQVTVTWMDADGNYLSRGSQIAAQLEGTVLKYRISLPQTLAMEYQLPEEGTYEVIAEENLILEFLWPHEKIAVSGRVTADEKNDFTPLAGAIVSISQTVNGYSKSFTAKTDTDGRWTIEDVYQAATEITVSKTSYVSQTRSYESLPETVPNFELEDINGTNIALKLTYTDVNGQTKDTYTDSVNVAYTVYNQTTGTQITGMSVQYPKIVLMEKLPKGTVLRVVATSKNQKFMPVEAMSEVNEKDFASVELNIKQLGGIRATYIKTDNTSIVGILYDANGKLVAKYDYADNKLDINELQDDEYTLVTMAGSQFFNNIFSLSQFGKSGLREGIDLVKNRVKVESGKIAEIKNQIIPYLDETKLYYTSPKTSFTVNKSQVSAGQYLTLTAFVNFKSVYASGVSNVKLVVDMPASTKFVESSVMIGNATASYTYDEANHSVIIPVENLSERIRFCIIPTAGGTYSPAAAVQFKFDDKTFTQPIGSVTYNVKDLSITVPSVVSGKSVPVSGSAVGKSIVKVYADDVLLAQTTSLANGSWTTNIDLLLEDETVKSTHTVYAMITTQDGVEMLTESQVVTYDPEALQVSNVIMYYTNPEENWWRGKNYELVHDFLSPSLKPIRYTYYIYNRSFTFAINFTSNDKERITDVILEVKTGDGCWNALSTKFDERKQCWLAYGEFGNMYDGIVPVNVRVKFTFGGTEFVVPYPGPDADVPIDPSGFVYEAVPTNRLQGVTATIYYKETTTDMYGIDHENIVLWDAEEYAQQNPLFTDENGMYRWDVPQGLWQVKFEKEGYLTTYSEWLPVPPPQLDVNIAMTQLQPPVVKKASAYEEGVEIEFDKFMDPTTLTTDNIKVTLGDNSINGTIELLDEEALGENNGQTYASKVRFNMPEDLKLASTEEVSLVVSSNVKSYAGVCMEADHTQDFSVTPKVRSIVIDSEVNVGYDQVRTLTVGAAPGDAAKGKKLLINVLSEAIAKVNATELTLDANGEAKFTVSGDMPGSTVITFEIEGVDLTTHTKVNVKEPELLKTVAPRASRVTGSQVYRNTKVQLTSDTENAVISYTVDGTDPTTSETAITYSEDKPIIITDDEVTIKAVAQGHDMEGSDVAQFDYTLKKSTIAYDLHAGWSWISHNLEKPVALSELNADIERITSQTQEVIKDPVVGLIGNLKTLNPGEAYKVKVAADASSRLHGTECNAAVTAVPIAAGWNWLGYPVNQTMTVAEALAFYEASEGDYIVGHDGYAQFADGEWKGDLEGFVPGKGYMFKAVNSSDIVFNNTIVSVAGSRMGKRSYLLNSPWAPAKYGYPNVMPLTAELYVNGTKADADEYIVGAFSDSECRGVGIWKEGRLMMTVYGNGGEDIHFVAKNLTDDIYYDITEQVNFTADNVGTWHAPYALSIGGESTKVEELNNKLSVTPNVVRDHITVSAAGRYISSLTLTNTGGRVVVSLTDLGKGATITTNQLPVGVYIVTVKADGQTFYKKIIKS